MSRRRPLERGSQDVHVIALEAEEELSRVSIDESRVHPTIPMPVSLRGRFERWLGLLRSGLMCEATSGKWWPHPELEAYLDGSEGLLATLQAIAAGLQRCSAQTTLGTSSFRDELAGARILLDSIPFCSQEHRRSFVVAALTFTLASTTRSCVRRAAAYYEVFSGDLTSPIPGSLHRIAVARVCNDLKQGTVRTFRHFMESSFRNGNPFPTKQVRDAAVQGLEPASRRVLAKPTKGRFESLAFIAALGGASSPRELWESLRPMVTRLVKSDPYLAAYAVDLFFPVSIKGAPLADEFLRREIQLFFSLDQGLGTRMQRHFTGYFPLDWESILRGRIPPLPPTTRGLHSQSDATQLKHHLIAHYVPARRSQRIPEGIEIIPAQATALGRLTGELFSLGCGAYLTLLPDVGVEPQYAFRPHSLVVGTSCILPRSHPGELYLALGKAFHHIPRNGTLVRLTPTIVSTIATTQYSEESPAETLCFSTVSSLLFEVRWLSRRLLAHLRGDEGAQVQDDRLVLDLFMRRTRERLLEGEATYRRCREQLLFITQYYRGDREGAIDVCQYPEWPGILTGSIGLSLERGISTVNIPLSDHEEVAAEDLEQLLFDELSRLDPILRSQFDETVAFIVQSLAPYPAMRTLIDFAQSSERRRSRGRTIRHLGQRSRSLMSRAVGTMKACIGR